MAYKVYDKVAGHYVGNGRWFSRSSTTRVYSSKQGIKVSLGRMTKNPKAFDSDGKRVYREPFNHYVLDESRYRIEKVEV